MQTGFAIMKIKIELMYLFMEDFMFYQQ